MNYRRGLIRVFAVTTICWYLAAGLVLYPQWAQAIHARRVANRILLAAPNGAEELRLLNATAVLLIGPVDVCALAFAVAWIVREFRSPPTRI